MSESISLIIRCFNEERHLGKLLKGIHAQTIKNVEIIIVDSGSTDRSLEIAQSHSARIVRIPPSEFSFGRSLNLGCREASGDILVIVSAHVYPLFDDWLDQLIKPFNDPQIDLVYGMQRGNETTQFSERQIFRRWFPLASNYNQPHPFCNNANAAIRRRAWEDQQYDESLTGLEDLAWAKKAMSRGRRIAYVAEAPVIHVHTESPKQTYNRYRREAIAYAEIMQYHRFTLLDLLRMTSSNVLADIAQAAISRCLRQSLKSIIVFRCAQFYGTYRGVRHRGKVTRDLRQRFYYPPETMRKDRDMLLKGRGTLIVYDS